MAASTRFLQTYTNYLRDVVLPTWEQLNDVFEEWCEDAFWENKADLFVAKRAADDELFPEASVERDSSHHPSPTPVLEIDTRVKWFDSVVEKISRSDQDFPRGHTKPSLEQMHDILGGRVVVYLPAQLRWVDAVIRNSEHFELRPDRKPKSYLDSDTLGRIGLRSTSFEVNRRKATGYASLHYILRLKPAFADGARVSPWFELQVRTAAENLWGEIEHHLGYKPKMDTQFSVRRQFRVISDHLKAIDLHLDFIFQELEFLQSSSRLEPGDPLNAESLPRILGGVGVRLPQHDLGALNEILQAYNVLTVEDLHRLLEFNLLEDIRNAWMQAGPGDPPTAIQIVHVLATLRHERPTADELERRVRAFVEYEKAATKYRRRS